jgi:mevalonate kinase
MNTKNLRQIEVFVPGKVMLAGEYSVLRGGHALAVALSGGMTVKVEWDPQAAQWEIHSGLWPEPKIVFDDHTPQLDMLCRAVQFMAKQTGMHGGKVTVHSLIEVKHGVGSSSALRLGVCGAFLALKNGPDLSRAGGISLEATHAAWQLQSEGQGLASGYDIISQYAGGLAEFNFEYEHNKWKPKWFRHELEGLSDIVHVFVGGKGAPTAPTIQTTTSWLEGGNRFERLLDISETLIDALNMTVQWPDKTNLRKLTSACGAARHVLSGSPHFPTDLAMELSSVIGLDQTWSWKTTGAGGEDAIILVGTRTGIQHAAEKLWASGWHRIEHEFTMTGAHIVSITDESGKSTRDQSWPIIPTTPKSREYLK